MARKTNRALVTTEEERNKILEENKELVEDFLNYLETTDHAPKSINVYKSNLNIFFVWLKDCYVHSFRHFFVSSLRRANIPLDIIKDIVGHASSEVTAIYDDNPREDGFLKYFSDDGIVHIKETSLSDI